MGHLLSNGQIISGLRQGENETIWWFYDHLFPAIKNFILKHQGTETEAMDVFQDGMMILFKRIKYNAFVPQGDIKDYFFGICRNLWFKKVGRKIKRQMGKNEEIITNLFPIADKEEVLNDEIKYALFYRHFNQLEKVCRDILFMFFNGVSYLQMSRELNKYSPQYLPKKKHRCLKKLIQSIKSDPDYFRIS